MVMLLRGVAFCGCAPASSAWTSLAQAGSRNRAATIQAAASLMSVVTEDLLPVLIDDALDGLLREHRKAGALHRVIYFVQARDDLLGSGGRKVRAEDQLVLDAVFQG